MKMLRKVIRDLILETSKDQAELKQLQQDNIELVVGPYYSRGKRISLPDEYKKTTDYLRSFKRFWNEKADHNYFNSITCVHWINYIANHKSSNRAYKESLKRILQGNPPIPPNKISKNEFSTIGYESGKISGKGTGIVGLKIKNRRVTFAAVVDSWTEYNHGTSAKLKDYYKSSGLPKRPFLQINPDNVIFDKEDFNKSSMNYFKEIIIDNWTWDTVMIDNGWLWHPGIKELIDYIENNWNKSNTDNIINIEYF
tara:strand:- start:498 stop:1259 length:762 start_codon:yes stop_codon:yes gene_type:complete